MSWEDNMQHEAEDHLEACWQYHNAAESTLDDEGLEALGDDPAIGPWCGCTTCEVREVLLVAIPHVARAIKAGEVTVEDLLA